MGKLLCLNSEEEFGPPSSVFAETCTIICDEIPGFNEIATGTKL